MEQTALFPTLIAPSPEHQLDDAFNELRALLSSPPSQEIWLGLWELLEAAPDELLFEAYIPYVTEHIAHWPSGLRAAPTSFRPFFFSTEPKYHKKAEAPTTQALLSLIDALAVSPNQTFGSDELLALANNPLCQPLTSLQLYGDMYDHESIEAFAQSPYLQGVKDLTLRGKPDVQFAFNQPMLEAFGASPWFAQLCSLTLDRCEASFDYAELPPMDFSMPQLASLTLQEADVDGLLAVWLSTSTLPPITTLNLDRSLPSPDLMERLISHQGASSLCSLSCQNTYSLQSNCVLQTLGQIDSYPQLESLQLEHLASRPGDLQEFLCHRTFPALTSLGLSSLLQGNALGALLRDASFTPQLRSLSIHFEELGQQAIKQWLQQGPFEALEELELRGSCKTEEALHALLHSGSLPALKTLRLDSNQLGKKAGTPLARPHQCTSLRQLDVSGNGLGDELVLLLLENVSTPQLERLRCVSCGMSIPGLYTLLTTEKASTALKRAALLDRLEHCTLVGLQEFLSDQGVAHAHRWSKGRAVSRLHQVIQTPEQIQQFLCHPGHTKKLSSAAQKATLRALGVKGYSKLSAHELRRLTEKTLAEWEGELPQIEPTKLRKKLTAGSK